MKNKLLTVRTLYFLLHFLLSQTEVFGMDDEKYNETSFKSSIARKQENSEKDAIPQSNNNNEIGNINHEITKIKFSILQELEKYKDKKKIILLGSTSSGKTTLIHGMANRMLNAEKRKGGGFDLDSPNPLPNFKIGHGAEVGTKVPQSWNDEKSELVYWDCPGFDDIRGVTKDVINEFSRKLLLRSDLKILLVATEASLYEEKGQPFLKKLKRITHVFQDNDELKKSLSLVITKAKEIELPEKMESIRDDIKNNPETADILDKRTEDLLGFFIEKHESRVSLISYPLKTGEYNFNKEAIEKLLCNSGFVSNPKVEYSNDAEMDTHLISLSKQVNQEIENCIKEGGRATANSYNESFLNYKKKASDLRASYQEKGTALETLQKRIRDGQLKAPVDELKKFIDMPEQINKLIKQIDFLKEICPSVNYDLNSWAYALSDLIKKLSELGADPHWVYSDDILSQKNATLIGLSDINTQLKRSVFKAVKIKFDDKPIDVFFIDEDIKSPGTDFTIDSVNWCVTKDTRIDLSGNENGQNAGNFTGRGENSNGLEKIEFIANGAKGRKGENGNLDDVRNKTCPFSKKQKLYLFRKLTTYTSTFEEIYKSRGKHGREGGKEGKFSVNISEKNDERNGKYGELGENGISYGGVYLNTKASIPCMTDDSSVSLGAALPSTMGIGFAYTSINYPVVIFLAPQLLYLLPATLAMQGAASYYLEWSSDWIESPGEVSIAWMEHGNNFKEKKE